MNHLSLLSPTAPPFQPTRPRSRSSIRLALGLFCLLLGAGAPDAWAGVTFHAVDQQVFEGNAGSPNVEVTVQMQGGPLATDVTIDWSTSDGTATTADNDYFPAGGTLTLFAGQTFAKALIPVVGDLNPEPDEEFNVSISNPSQGTVIDSNADVTILDDDGGLPLELKVRDVSVVEGDVGSQDVKVMVDLVNGPAAADVTMDWQTFDGTALANDGDYEADMGDLLIPAGATFGEVVLNVFGDTVDEGDEFFELKIFNAVGATIVDERGDVIIKNDDAPNFDVRILDAQLTEGDAGTQLMEFTVEVEGDGGGTLKTLPPFSVDYQTVAGTATAGEDFEPVSGTLNFVDNSTQTIHVPIIGDTIDEPGESFLVRLTNPVNVTLIDGEASGLIVDDDNPDGELTIVDAQLAEGDEGTTEMLVEVHLQPAQNTVVRVSYQTLDGTAAAGSDYQARGGQLLFNPGETVKQIPVPILGDTEIEDDETFQVQLFNAIGSTLADDLADAVILDDDGVDLPALSLGDATVIEGDSGTIDVPLVVTLSQSSETPVQVSYSTFNGTAIAGADYEAQNGTLVFEPGDTETQIVVRVLGDLEEEGEENFFVRLSSPDGAELADEEGQVTIVDNEVDQALELSIDDVRVVEGNQGQSTAVFTLRLASRAKARIMVDFTTRDGTALASDGDYQPTSGRLDFDSGDTSITLEVPVFGDLRVEDDEVFFIDLSNPDGAVLGDATARCVIANDDSGDGPGGGSAGFVRLVPGTSAMEGAGPAVIQVERFGGNAGVASVLVSTANGTAVGGQDFQGVSQRIQWSSGQSGPLTVEVPILDDAVTEGPETFTVALSAPTGARLSTPFQVSVPVVDDDVPMALEAVGALERTVEVRTEQDLQVRVVTEDGAPVAGAVVQWSTEGRARLPGPGRTTSNGDGLVTQTVLFGPLPGDAAVTARLAGTDEFLTFVVEVEGDLRGTIGGDGGDDPTNEEGLARNLDETCADAEGTRYSELCDFIYNQANTDDQRDTVEQLTPRSALAQARTALRTPAQQVRNITSRLSVLRSGRPGSSFGSLAFAVQGDGISLGPLQQAVVAHANDTEPYADSLDDSLRKALDAENPFDHGPWEARDKTSARAGAARGGAASGDQPDDGFDPYDATESPWGFFMNGRASFGDAPRRGVELGYDFSTQGLTAGLDYRASNQWVVGASLGYSRSDNDVFGPGGGEGGSIEAEGLSLSLFTTFYREDFYVDGVVTFGSTEFDVERVIRLPQNLNGLNRFVATGSPDGDELSIHLGFGYDFRIGPALNLNGFVNGNYVRSSVDSYTETGADLLNLTFDDQELDSLLGEVGVELTYPYSLSWGVLQPLVRVAFLREFEDDVQIVRARFAEDPNRRRFLLASERPDRSYLNLALGLTATLQGGWATYFQYDTDLERDDLDIYTLTGGFRRQF